MRSMGQGSVYQEARALRHYVSENIQIPLLQSDVQDMITLKPERKSQIFCNSSKKCAQSFPPERKSQSFVTNARSVHSLFHQKENHNLL
jgi:hypothetical protein